MEGGEGVGGGGGGGGRGVEGRNIGEECITRLRPHIDDFKFLINRPHLIFIFSIIHYFYCACAEIS